MKGPGYRYDVEIRRKWECPACGRQMLLPGHLTQKICHCREEPTWMKLLDVDWRRTFPERQKIVIPDDPPVEQEAATETPVAETLDEVPSTNASQVTESEETAPPAEVAPQIEEPEEEKAPDRKPDLVLGAADAIEEDDSESDISDDPSRKRRRKKRRRKKGGQDKPAAQETTANEPKNEVVDSSSSSEVESTDASPATHVPPQETNPDNDFGSGV